MNSKQKGSGFEREISKKISLWLTNDKRDDYVWRTQNSGGRWTIRDKVGKKTINQEGDIGPTSPELQFFFNKYYVECKNYNDIMLWSIVTETGNLYNWLSDYLNRSSLQNKQLLLVVKQSRKPIMILTNDKQFNTKPKLKNKVKFRVFMDKNSINVILLDDLLNIDYKLLFTDEELSV